jgi:hypothetical protein
MEIYILMNAKLTKYLSDVFRNEPSSKLKEDSKESTIEIRRHQEDRKLNQFIVDRKYSLRLDEII